jgi:hypothetical protein
MDCADLSRFKTATGFGPPWYSLVYDVSAGSQNLHSGVVWGNSPRPAHAPTVWASPGPGYAQKQGQTIFRPIPLGHSAAPSTPQTQICISLRAGQRRLWAAGAFVLGKVGAEVHESQPGREVGGVGTSRLSDRVQCL